MNKLIDDIDRLAADEHMKHDSDERHYMSYERLYHEFYWIYKNIENAKPIIDEINPAANDLDEKELLECVNAIQKGMRVAAADCIRAVERCEEWLDSIHTGQAAKNNAKRTLKEVQS